MSKNRFKFVAAVAVIIEREDGKILVQKRKGSFADGFYMLPTGHVDGGESLMEAMAREIAEETGLEVSPFGLELVQMAHSAYDTMDELITYFYHTDDFYGEAVNREPEKCAEMVWVDPKKLPEPFLIHAKNAVRAWLNGDEVAMVTYPLKPRVNVIELTAMNRLTKPKLPGPKPPELS